MPIYSQGFISSCNDASEELSEFLPSEVFNFVDKDPKLYKMANICNSVFDRIAQTPSYLTGECLLSS